MKIMNKAVLGLGVGMGLLATSAQGAGFAIIEQSVSGLGSAFAGAAASAEDASTIFFNPAGMTKLKDKTSVVGALHYINPSLEFSNTASGVTGNDGGEAGVAAVVPNVYYVNKMDNGSYFGLGINAPFGLSTDYDEGWRGRFYALESSMQTVNINPSMAFQANSKLSIGVGINIQYATAKLTRAIDVTTVCGYLSGIPGSGVAACGATNEGEAEVTGSSIAWGANYGVLYDFSDATRIGFHYRTGVRHRIDGEGEFTGIHTNLTTAGFLVDSDAEAVVNLPATASLSLSQNVSPAMTILADATWTNWDQLSELRVTYDQGRQGDTVEKLEWQNTGRYSVGMLYGLSDNMTLRAGVALDQSPTPNEEYRSVRVPDADRTWVAVGLGYKLNNGMKIDAAIANLSVDEADVNKNEGFNGQLTGEFDSSVNIFSVQASMSF